MGSVAKAMGQGLKDQIPLHIGYRATHDGV